jgi:putative peptidoglycan lipid II flippase
MVQTVDLPPARVWLWAALSSGLILVFPLVARSLASSAGEGALASFNYAWKLIELPLVLAVQLVASLAFPAITRTQAGTPQRQQAVGLAFLIAWALACAAIAVVATFSLPIASLLFGWGRMSAASLDVIAQWSAIGIWSLLPQALMAVLLTVMATHGRMHVAVWVLASGLAVLLAAGLLGGFDGETVGSSVMWLLNVVFACMAVVLMLFERRSISGEFPYLACLAPLLVCAGLVALKPWVVGLNLPLTLILCAVYALLVASSAIMTSPVLRGLLRDKLNRKSAAALH